ncbi:hypothetical protein ACIBCB_28940 [Streptomyces uncialis]|uniref:hypothetical protein n=1 Tax=Streptomyces uncialis TaxID=1048205 RepID=UPI0037919306|nr:hypothetical protein OG268_21835 [Streptomyces uncialis]
MPDPNPLRTAFPHVQWGAADISEDDAVLHPPSSPGAACTAVTPAQRLQTLRTLCNGDSHELPERRVALYVRGEAGREGEADAVFARLRGYAERRGWEVGAEYQEVDGFFPSGSAPAWEAVRLGVATGFVHGVLTVDRGHLDPDDQVYEDEIRAVCEGTGFLVLLVPETAADTTPYRP